MSDYAEQEVVNVEFTWLMECERTLDDVVAKLGSAGIKIAPEERVVVARWLDMFSEGSRLPLRYRLMMLYGMLEASRETSCPAP